MGGLTKGDDGLPAEEVGYWVKEKHQYLCRYLDISRAVRARWIGPGNAGATYIDPFCGPGRCLVKNTGEWIDGGAVAAWKKSCEGGAPFTKMYIGDLDASRLKAAEARLQQLRAPVVAIEGVAMATIPKIVARLNPYGLHFAFLDPFNLGALDFRIIEMLSKLKRIDILVHRDQMGFQRNLDNYTRLEESAFDAFAPGWREKVDLARGQTEVRRQVRDYWREKVASLGVWPSIDLKLITGSRNQPLYWLLLAARHDLAHKFWAMASNIEGQGKLL